MKRTDAACTRCHLLLILWLTTSLGGCTGDRGTRGVSSPAGTHGSRSAPATLDLREPMALAAEAIVRRLDPAQDYRPWFLLRGQGGIPATAEHASWDLGDMTGRYLEGLILTRRMGVSRPEFSTAEGQLGRYLLSLLGPDGLVHDPKTGAVDHSFSQGSDTRDGASCRGREVTAAAISPRRLWPTSQRRFRRLVRLAEEKNVVQLKK